MYIFYFSVSFLLMTMYYSYNRLVSDSLKTQLDKKMPSQWHMRLTDYAHYLGFPKSKVGECETTVEPISTEQQPEAVAPRSRQTSG